MAKYTVQSKTVYGLEVPYTEHVVVLVDDQGDVTKRIAGFIHLTCAQGLAAQLQEAFEDGVDHSLSVFKEAATDFNYPTHEEGYKRGYSDGYSKGRNENTEERIRRANLYQNATEDPEALELLKKEEFFKRGKEHAARFDRIQAKHQEDLEDLDTKMDPLREQLSKMVLGDMDGERSWEALTREVDEMAKRADVNTRKSMEALKKEVDSQNPPEDSNRI